MTKPLNLIDYHYYYYSSIFHTWIRIHFKVLVLHYLYNVSHVGNFTWNFIDYFVASNIIIVNLTGCLLVFVNVSIIYLYIRIFYIFQNCWKIIVLCTCIIPMIERPTFPDIFVKQLWSGNEQHRKLSSINRTKHIFQEY